MRNLRKIFIPKDKSQSVTELESWTLKWETQGIYYDTKIVNHKCFVDNDEAKEFEKQLKDSAKFLNVWVRTELNKN